MANTSESWGSLSKLFHGLIVIMIFVQVPAGFLMSYTYGLALHAPAAMPLHNLASQIHHTTGFAILFMLAARLAWRLSRTDSGLLFW